MKIDSILILAAGRGIRLKPHTDNTPKSLLPLGNTNILRRLLEQSEMYFSGVKVYVNASYLAEKIINEISNCPIVRRPIIIWEQNPLGPALTVTNHCNETSSNVLVLHGDIFFSDQCFSEFSKSIIQKEQDGSILLCHQRSNQNARSRIIRKGGLIQSILEINVTSQIINDKEITSDLVWSNSGAIVVKKNSLLGFRPEIGEGISPSLINYIASNGDLCLEECKGTRIAIDNERAYFEAIKANQKNEGLLN